MRAFFVTFSASFFPTLTSRAFLYVILACATASAQQPRIDSVFPAEGPVAGGTTVVVRGANFQEATITVDKGIVASAAISPTEIRFTTPPHDNGIVSIRAANAAGAAHAEFLYVPPRLEELAPGYITTVAGIGAWSGFYRRATEAELQPQGNLAFDKEGNLYVTEAGQERISRIRADGIFEPFAGSGAVPLPGQNVGDHGPAENAFIHFPRGVTVDEDGTVYLADSENRIRRVDGRTRVITTIAGNGMPGFSGDGGPAAQALLHTPTKMAGDGRGTIFFIDHGNARIRRITPAGVITTVAGNGTFGFSGDGGPASQAQFKFLADDGALALDPGRYLYLADTGNDRVRRINLQTGIIETIVGPTDAEGAPTDGLYDIALDASGNLYFTTFGRIRAITPTGQLVASYGSRSVYGWSEDGTLFKDIKLSQTAGLVIDSAGNVTFNQFRRVRRLNVATGRLETVGGIEPQVIGENDRAIATTLSFSDNGDIALLPTGELLIGDGGHRLLRKIDRNGIISTIARGGVFAPPEWRGETFGGASSLKADAAGNIYLTDTGLPYRLGIDGILRRIAGRQGCGFSGDGGPGLDAQLCQPWDVIVDRSGNYLIADANNNRIRRADARTGIITTIAGSGAVNGLENYFAGSYCGDGGPAVQACLNTPQGIAVDSAGNVFIADRGNSRIRKIDLQGTMTTFANDVNGSKLTFDTVGRLYARHAFSVWRYDQAGAATLLAGTSLSGFSGDGGPALDAQLSPAGAAAGIAIDAEGNIFFTDGSNSRVRAIRYGAVLAPADATIQATATGTTIRAAVLDGSGRPVPGVRVDFIVPEQSPSCRFPNNARTIGVVTGVDGIAVTTCVPGCGDKGTIPVTSRPLTANTVAVVQLSSSGGPCSRRAVRH